MQVEKVSDHIVNWLRNYVQEAKMEGFVVGVSGGVDSAVTSTLCAKTGLRTLCVEMPIHQSKGEVSRSTEHIEGLKKRFANVTNVQVGLTPVFESFKKQVPTDSEAEFLDLSLANTRARLRMATLYYFAGLHRYLVCGTGNKVEDFGVGFYTKYGDGGVDISPIADLMKSEIYALAGFLKVPVSIRKAAPTDGLFGDTRTDESQLGATYDELEWAMKMKESGLRNEAFSDRQKKVLNIYTRLHNANLHKMSPIPICKIPLQLMI